MRATGRTAALIIAGLTLGGPAAWAATYTGGPGAGYASGAMTNDTSLATNTVTISSATNQSFGRGYTNIAISMITVADDPAVPVIKNGTPIGVWIPASLAMTWDETNATPTFGGSAAGKVGAVSYSNSNQRLIIAVTADFAAGDTLTISDLSFKNYLCSGAARLVLDYNNDGIADAQDDKTITIFNIYYGGPRGDYTLDQMLVDKALHPLNGAFFSTR